MKINRLELAKTISDFMFLWIENPEKKAKQLFNLKHRLDNRWHWFEKYIQYYFKNCLNYKVELNWRTNQQDNWIDLKWIKLKNWKKEYLIVQCKKYSIKDITLDDVASFFWKIARNYIKYQNQTEVYYITTTKFTKKAKDFLIDQGIDTIDFEKISELQESYSLDTFKKELLSKEWEKEVSKCFNQEQKTLNLNDNIINTINATNNEVFQLLRQIRRDIKDLKQLELWDIATNNTLLLLAKRRPHNLIALKEITNTFSTRERNKLDKYWEIFIERLKYLQEKELEIKTIKKDPYLKEILKFKY